MSSFGGFIGTNMSNTTNIAQPHLLCPLIPMPTPNSPAMSFTLQSKMENGGLTDREFDPNIMGKLKEEGCDSRSGGDNFEGASGDDLEAVAADDEKGPRRRKKYHRHTTQQIQELEAFFKECPHPDEKQRLELSRKLSLGTKQVKFWFQNRRTQMKTQMERHENVILKQENDRLRLENIAIKDAIRNPICNNCGGPAAIGDISYEDHHLRIENARLKDELNRISAIADRFLGRPISLLSNHIPPLGPNSGLELAVGRNGFGNLSSMNTALSMGVDLRDGTLSAASSFMPLTSQATSLPLLEMPLERSMSFELAVAAMDELAKKALINNPLWIRSMDEEKEILNREEYMRTFTPCIGMKPGNFVTEATRETTMVNVNSLALVETLMDVDRWAEMFPCLIARAFITDVISPGMNGTRNGTLQLMHAELQVLSPLVPARLVRFLRFSKQHADGVWTVVDVSIDSIQEGSNAYTFSNCRRLPSGCVVQDMPNGCSKVTWVEHSEYDESAVPAIYRQLLSSGMGYGAQRWVATLQRQCECLEILMSSAVPLGTGLTPTGRNNLLKLAQRMVDNFCSGICGSSTRKWEKLQTVNLGEDVRVMTRKSLDEPGDPSGVVLSAATSVSLPVTMQRLFDFLRDESMRSEWDILSTGGPMQEVTHISKGQYHGNGVSLLRATTTSTNQSSMLILQETWTDASGSLIVYAPVNISAMSSVMNGGDSAYVALLPSGFAIVPGGPLVKEIEGSDLGGGGGSLLTVGFQILVNNLPSSKLTMESVETVKNLISCTIQKIKAALRCT